MNSKQIFLIFFLFILTLFIITLPVWLDKALPTIKQNLNSAIKSLEDMRAALKFIIGRLAQDFMRLDKYVFQG